MATVGWNQEKEHVAGAAVTQYALCKTSAGKIIHTTGNTDQGWVFAQEAATADGDKIAGVSLGYSKAIAGGTISAGDRLMPDSGTAGRVVTRTSTNTIVAIAQEGAVSGDVFEVLVTLAGA